MATDLKQNEIRVLGCLIEKQLTTPDYYPLTLSALVTACNQKSNREPVLSLSENDVLDAITGLNQQNLAREKQMPHARVAKYEHKMSDTLTKQYDFSQKELAVLTVLFLRGPQTPGEIRSRTNRMYNFTTLEEVDETLRTLAVEKSEPYVKALSRQPGRREIRYAQLFGEHDLSVDNNTDEHIPVSSMERSSSESVSSEVEALRDDVAELRQELAELKQMVDDLLK